MLALSAFVALAQGVGTPAAPGADALLFHAAPGAKVSKRVRITHELRIDEMGYLDGDLPLVPDGTGGWISATADLHLFDEYVRTAENRPLEFVRTLREIQLQGKLNASRSGGQKLQEASRSTSPLRKQSVRFTWIEAEHDWSRAYERVDADEPLLAELAGEFELLALLPGKPVAPGETWSVPLDRLRSVFAPGGDLQTVPTGPNLFGRTMEIGVGGDYADFFHPIDGVVTAEYKGRRSIAVGDAGATLEVGVVALELDVISHVDRQLLYRTAMPPEERREPARVDGVPFDYTVTGKGELLWDFSAKRAHALTIEGHETVLVTVHKTRADGHGDHRYGQQARYSGPLSLKIEFEDGSALPDEAELDSPRLRNRQKQQGK